jgi:hypothetical protein
MALSFEDLEILRPHLRPRIQQAEEENGRKRGHSTF